MEKFPTVGELAIADLDDVLAAWTGLGYYSRARNLHKGANYVVNNHHGVIPDTADALRLIPGIGPYTAGAISSIAFGKQEALVDGNVIRVLARVFDIDDNIATATAKKRFWATARNLVPAESPGDFNQGLMELGATLCLPKNSRCPECPLGDRCAALKKGVIAERPVKTKRPRKEEKQVLKRAALFAERDQKILLAKRPEEGLYGGLWELPLAKDKEALVAKTTGSVEFANGKEIDYQQELSHRVLNYRVWRAKMSGEFRCSEYQSVAWHDFSALPSLGLSTATKNIIEKMTNPRKTSGQQKEPNV